MNWIFLDDQFNYVSSLSGSVQAASSTYPSAHLNTVAPGSQLAFTKSGYLYIWVSNETQGWDVFFDNLSIQYKQWPLLEMNNYYPFGLTMQGLSDKAIKTNYAENKYRFNQGTELQNKEFSDGTGLEMYETSFRGLDPQLGRFSQIDPMADGSHFYSTYQYAINNPVLFTDPSGLLQESPQTIQTIYGFMNRLQQEGGGSGSDIDQDFQSIDDLNATIANMQALQAAAQNSAFFQSVWDGTPNDGQYHYYTPDADGSFSTSPTYYNYENPGHTAIFQTTEYHGMQSNAVGENYTFIGLSERGQTVSFDGSLLQENSGLENSSNIIGAMGLSWDILRNGLVGAHRLANGMSGTSYAIQDIGKLKLIKGISMGTAGKMLGVAGVAFTFVNIGQNGFNWSNSTDLVMDGVAIIPVVGWAISGAYFIGNVVVEANTGNEIGYFIGQYVTSAPAEPTDVPAYHDPMIFAF